MMNKIVMLMLAAVILTMTACSGSSQPDLNGTRWNLASIQGKPVLPDTQPGLNFKDGQASGNGSCNGIGGEYTVKGNKLTFGPFMSTMMACYPTEVMDQEQAYLSALSSTASYRLDGSRLILFDATGVALLEFTATP